MPTARPFAYNTGSTISGTVQVGNLAVGYPTIGFEATGLQWWNGPDEDLGYVIARPNALGARTSPTGILPLLGFIRSTQKTDESFLELATLVTSGETFSHPYFAKIRLEELGYWSSWEGVAPSPTPTQTPTNTITPSITPTNTPTPTITPTITPTPIIFSVQYLVVAGGGGSRNDNASTGGGGAGGLLTNQTNVYLSSQHTISVGAGGNTGIYLGDKDGGPGSQSYFGCAIACGGGPSSDVNSNGGSGGGGTGYSTGVSDFGLGVSGQGNNGGSAISNRAGGGGGGAGAIGGNARCVVFDGDYGGNGGNGIQSSISGINNYYAGGGGGGSSPYPGTGGLGGGGNGSTGSVPNNGGVNTGGGGGGRYTVSTVNSGGRGGSGIVILRYPNTYSLNIGSGVVAICINCSVGTNERYTCIIGGTGNVCWTL